MRLKTFGSCSRTGNSHLVEIEGVKLLLDAGRPPRRFGIPLSEIAKIDAILVTHEHQDHAKYVPQLLEMALDIYMTEGTMRGLGISHHRIKIIKKEVKVGHLTVRAFPSFHDAEEPVNFIIKGEKEKLAYITDTGKAPYLIKNLTHLLIEANYSQDLIERSAESGEVEMFVLERTVQNHLSISQVINFLKNNDISRLQQIWLTHLSTHNADPELFKELVEKATGKEVYIAKEE